MTIDLENQLTSERGRSVLKNILTDTLSDVYCFKKQATICISDIQSEIQVLVQASNICANKIQNLEKLITQLTKKLVEQENIIFALEQKTRNYNNN